MVRYWFGGTERMRTNLFLCLSRSFDVSYDQQSRFIIHLSRGTISARVSTGKLYQGHPSPLLK